MKTSEFTVTKKEKAKLDQLMKIAKTDDDLRMVKRYWVDWCAYWRKQNE